MNDYKQNERSASRGALFEPRPSLTLGRSRVINPKVSIRAGDEARLPSRYWNFGFRRKSPTLFSLLAVTLSGMANILPFNIIPHDTQDHRYISRSEVSSHPYFDPCMSTGFPASIKQYALRDGERFLRSTSKWTEQHLFAFKCLY